ncbi:UvrD-helicase domain-containing protein [Lacipirellula sp.]|uniref:UvrD-helicase domain-containing protein n=1 Tax=Lacipirellula sp. TaxID=2691419 RepID=UPI003D102E85
MAKSTAINPAEAVAEKVQRRIFECIDQRKSFLVEAGAGAGKTHSLIGTLQYLIETQGIKLSRNNQQVACITFTNVATDEIRARTDRHPIINADTIHSFCWSLMRPFQSSLRAHLPNIGKWEKRLEEAGSPTLSTVNYSLGYPSITNGDATLHHDDVLSLTIALLAEPKFRQVLAGRYPVILIDEYQDTDKNFAEAILTHLVGAETGPLVGFFGDHWQKIYGTGCGAVDQRKLEVIGKKSNFRSVPAIVNVLNKMRPELQQAVTNPQALGSAIVYHTNAWSGARDTGSHRKGDLAPEDGHQYLLLLKTQLADSGWDLSADKTKILMLTHKVLAAEQGYRQLADVFDRNESYVKKEDPHVAFFVDMVEPVCRAYEEGKLGSMFHALGVGRPAITSKEDKVAWKRDMDKLLELRKTGTVGQVIDHLKSSKIEIPNGVQRSEENANEPENERSARTRALRDVAYSEVTAFAEFIQGHTSFETKHGVKGAQFENVLVVFGRGWNIYDFNQMLEVMARTPSENELPAYERNRNLFYVVCSRPKTNLVLLFTQALSPTALERLAHLFGNEAIHALPDLSIANG